VKVILKQDVPNLGRTGEVKRVADGYARNYLIPQGMAVRATASAMKDFEHRQEVQARKHERMKKRAETLARQLTAHTLTFEVKTGETGQLYGSITNADIAEALQEEVGVEIDRRDIPLAEPIREVGEHFVPVHLMEDVEPQVRVVVKPEGGELPADVEAAEEGAS
jgi:large subunit ribosomal protein L9